jgi:hypothetical protein
MIREFAKGDGTPKTSKSKRTDHMAASLYSKAKNKVDCLMQAKNDLMTAKADINVI